MEKLTLLNHLFISFIYISMGSWRFIVHFGLKYNAALLILLLRLFPLWQQGPLFLGSCVSDIFTSLLGVHFLPPWGLLTPLMSDVDAAETQIDPLLDSPVPLALAVPLVMGDLRAAGRTELETLPFPPTCSHCPVETASFPSGVCPVLAPEKLCNLSNVTISSMCMNKLI